LMIVSLPKLLALFLVPSATGRPGLHALGVGPMDNLRGQGREERNAWMAARKAELLPTIRTRNGESQF
jgi:hypothetical protein